MSSPSGSPAGNPPTGAAPGTAGAAAFTRPDPDLVYPFDDDIGRGDLLPHFPGGAWPGEPIPVVVREHGRARPIGKGAATLALIADGVQAQVTWPKSVETYMEGVPFSSWNVEWAADGTPERIVAVANDPRAADAADAAEPAAGETDDPDDQESANLTAQTTDAGDRANPDVDRPARDPNPRKTMTNKIEFSQKVEAAYQKFLDECDGDETLLAKRLIETNRNLKSDVIPADHVAVLKTDADLLTSYRELGKPDELRTLKTQTEQSKGEADRLRKDADELGRFKELGEFDAVSKLITDGREAAGKLATIERRKSLDEVAKVKGYNPDAFAKYAATEGMDFVPTKVKEKGKEVPSFSVKTRDADGKEVVRPIEEVETSDWADLGPALRGVQAPQNDPIASHGPGGFRPTGRSAPVVPNLDASAYIRERAKAFANV